MSKAGWIRTVLLVGAVAALELACRTGAIAPTMVTAPSKMVTTLFETLRSDEIGMHLRHTLSAVAIAMSIAIVGGFVIGFILNWVPFLRRAFSPFSRPTTPSRTSPSIPC